MTLPPSLLSHHYLASGLLGALAGGLRHHKGTIYYGKYTGSDSS